MNTIASRPLEVVSQATAGEIKAQVQLIQQVMREIMIEDVHYGRVPGTPRPSLWKPGAEVLCSVFRIAPRLRVEDLSTSDTRRYRVICLGQHQATMIELGEGVGECSSDENKFKWRSPVCPEEFDETPENLRRAKWMKGSGKPYKQQQIRNDPADGANTILKMASKRALVAMVLNVTAASDCFAQDLEDLPPPEGAEANDDTAARSARRGRSSARAPQATGDGPRMANEQQRKLIFVRLDQAGMSAEMLCTHLGIESLRELQFHHVNDALAFIADPQRGDAAGT